MNDFLQSIRGNQKEKRTPKTRRNFDNSNFNTSPNFQSHGNYQGSRIGNIKRGGSTRSGSHIQAGEEHQHIYTSQSQAEPSDMMIELLEIYTKNQEILINAYEKRIIAEERKAIALEEIAEYLRVITIPSFKESFSSKNIFTKKDKNDNEFYAAEASSIDEKKKDIDEEYVDNQSCDIKYNADSSIKDEDKEVEVEYSAGSSLQIEDEQKENSYEIKVIKRKKMENKADNNNKAESSNIELAEEADRTREGNNEIINFNESQVKLLSREEIMEIINSMRAKGKTFDEVAQHLVTLNQPTFSGRGVWHAQTIHRLCNKKSKK